MSGPRQIVAHFLDQKSDALPVPRNRLQPVSGFPDQVRDVDRRQRIGAVNFQSLTGHQRLECLAGPQHRKRTFQAGQIEHNGSQRSDPGFCGGAQILGAHGEIPHHGSNGLDVVESGERQTGFKRRVGGDAGNPGIGRI